MAGIKITDLPAAPSAQLTDVFPVDQLPGPVTYKESNSQLLALFKSSGGEALTEINDANVTMTLGGAPSTALLNAVSMTLGWTGQLSVPRGGTAKSSFTAFSVICGGTTATGALQSVVGLGTAGEQLTSNGPGALPTWQTGTLVTPSALTRVDDTNVTLTLGGTPSTALLQAVSITAGWAGQLSLARGGTNKNITPDNGAMVYCDADSFELLAATATAGQIVRSGANAAPSWSTATYPAAAGTSGNVLASDGTNWVSTAAAGIGSPLTTKGDLYTFSTVNARLAVGTTNGQILQVSSGAATGLAWSTATYPATATNAARILRSNGTNWVETTSTFADTYTASSLLYANGANNVAGLATVNSAMLTTDVSGVPTWVASTGSGAPVRATSPTLVTPVLGVAAATSIALGGGTALSNYVEGTWTPTVTLVGGAGNTVPVYLSNVGVYTRVGNVCYCTVSLAGDGGAEGAGTGVITITLPIAASGSTGNVGGIGQDGNYLNNTTRNMVGVSITPTATTFNVFPWTAIGGYAAALVGNDQNNTTRAIYLRFWYYV